VYVSIVGVDRIPYGYYRAKLATETVVEESGLPWTILRATQFHDLIRRIAGVLAKSPVVPVPAGVRFQPVDVHEVAARVVELATGTPAGRVDDMGGPPGAYRRGFVPKLPAGHRRAPSGPADLLAR
jgi:uncharacterized protein YbjT (DUF2867 family)